ncbi:glycosyltransferase [Dyella solisilvae]|uniref:Glycosyltransferase n=1 Tax=Dyella solisilvae TaxID=1920168 RepID=A0A370K5V0_9GAMM|nr:glycosyltransferase family 4 protein [Dyella solisilvae]RDI98008.1 glycosyltransferase [Dyella solisilvae]
MHVAQVNFLPAPPDRAPVETLQRWPSLVDIAEAAASAGVRVSVIQLAAEEGQVERNGIAYYFVDPRKAKLPAGRVLADRLGAIRAEVMHVHGLGFAEQAHAVSQHLPRTPVLFQDHADRLPRWWQRPRWRRWLAVASGAAFTAPELAEPFTRAGMFAPTTRLFAIPESSSRFTCGSRARAWGESGLYGDPCIVAVGHLSTGKDPLTVLRGIAQAADQLPGLQLWWAFGSAPLLHEVQRCIDGDARLAARLHLLGHVAHPRVEALMRAADIFVSGSLHESCGYALLEALACGVTPLVTDIPAHRALAGDVGALWPSGDARALAGALLRLATSRPSRERVRAHFDAHLSLSSLGRRWAYVYGEVLDGQRVTP